MGDKLKPCLSCRGEVEWCPCVSSGCHLIVCKGCGSTFDMSDTFNPETIEELKIYCANKWSIRKESANE